MINSISAPQDINFGALKPICRTPQATVQTVVKLADELGVDLSIANKRLRMAQDTKGINIKNPKLMKRAIAGEFEADKAVKPKMYLYKQKNYARTEGGPRGTIYTNGIIGKGKSLGRLNFMA